MSDHGTLYIAVDESGQNSRGRCYTVAGCWYYSERSDPEQVLKPTRRRAQAFVTEDNERGPDSLNELHATDIPDDMVDATARVIHERVYDDGTIAESSQVWSQSLPLRYTVHSLNPELTRRTISDYVGKLDAPTVIQIMALNTILLPLFRGAGIFLDSCTDIRVLLDSETWANPAQQFETTFSEVDTSTSPPRFEIRDSKSTPGIQFADFAAYSIRKEIVSGGCDSAAATVRNYLL